MRIATALLCIFLLAVAAGFHLYWGLGGQTGIRIALPQQENGQPILPFSRAGSVAFGLVLVVVMLLIAAQAGMIDFPLPHALLRASVLLWACLFLARALSWHRYVGHFQASALYALCPIRYLVIEPR